MKTFYIQVEPETRKVISVSDTPSEGHIPIQAESKELQKFSDPAGLYYYQDGQGLTDPTPDDAYREFQQMLSHKHGDVVTDAVLKLQDTKVEDDAFLEALRICCIHALAGKKASLECRGFQLENDDEE